MRYILAILSQLSEFYESLENDDDDDYDYDNDDKSVTVDNHNIDDPKYLRKFLTRLQRITAQILPQFCFSSSFAPNRNTWMVNTGRFFMMVRWEVDFEIKLTQLSGYLAFFKLEWSFKLQLNSNEQQSNFINTNLYFETRLNIASLKDLLAG